MSADGTPILRDRVDHTVWHARAFLQNLVKIHFGPGGSKVLPTSQHEMALGTSVRRLAFGLKDLEEVELPVQAELGVKALRTLFESLIRRWKWERVIGPDGDAFLKERWAMCEEKRRSYFSAARSHVRGHATGKIRDRPSNACFNDAKLAELEMIPPAEPQVESEEELKQILQVWKYIPYLGPEFPTYTHDEFSILKQAIRDIDDGRRGTPLEPAETEQPSPTAASEATSSPPALRVDEETPAAPTSGTPTPNELGETSEPAASPVVLGKPGDDPIVRGKRKKRLTVARYNVIKALLNAGDDGLTGDDLVNKSGHSGAVNVLKTLAKSDPDWGSVILLPGRPGARYRILSKSDGS